MQKKRGEERRSERIRDVEAKGESLIEKEPIILKTILFERFSIQLSVFGPPFSSVYLSSVHFAKSASGSFVWKVKRNWAQRIRQFEHVFL